MSIRNRDVCVVVGSNDSLVDETVQLCLKAATTPVEALSLSDDGWSSASDRMASCMIASWAVWILVMKVW